MERSSVPRVRTRLSPSHAEDPATPATRSGRSAGGGRSRRRSKPVEAALAAVARRPRSSFELKQLLLRRGYSDSDSAAAVARLEDLGYVDDLEFASVVAASVARTRGWGPARVRQELVKRGLSADVIEAAMVRAAAEGSHPSGNISRALTRLLRQRGMPRDRLERDRMRAALMRRGYSSTEITGVMEGLADGCGEEDGEET